MTPEGVAADPKKSQRRFHNLVHRYGKMKLRRNKTLRKLVKSKGKPPKDVGKTFTLVPKPAWLTKRLETTFGKI